MFKLHRLIFFIRPLFKENFPTGVQFAVHVSYRFEFELKMQV